jgi:hypothetical protein
VGSRWFSRRAVALHLTLAVVVPAFALLFLWQVRRATGGNDLSWAYVFEWPFFTGYAVYLWWKLLHETPDARRLDEPGSAAADRHNQPATAQLAVAQPAAADDRSGPSADGPAVVVTPDDAADDADDDDELAAYNRYLAELNASGPRKRW